MAVQPAAALAKHALQSGTINASQNPVPAGGTTILTASATDPDGDPLTITWTTSAGTLSALTGTQVTLTVPNTPGTVTVTATAGDGQGGTASASMTLLVVAANVAPSIRLNADPIVVVNGGTSRISAVTGDPNGDPVSVTWATSGGTLSATSGDEVTLTTPASGGTVTVTATAKDGRGGAASASLTLLLVTANQGPSIRLNANPLVLRVGHTTALTATTSDPNGDPVSVTWATSAGTLSATNGNQVTLTGPTSGTAVTVTAAASDGRGGTATASLTLILIPKNLPPTIRLNANPIVVILPSATPQP
ncbi:MAG: hypothetical protein HY260_21685 [Chloroflexi bacterium]|nr:hypothetical protein [Chloroflexota bacterium]